MDTQQDLRISFRRTKAGNILATVRIVSTTEVQWHRVSLPDGVDIFACQRDIVELALRRLERAGARRPTSLQVMLPVPAKGE